MFFRKRISEIPVNNLEIILTLLKELFFVNELLYKYWNILSHNNHFWNNINKILGIIPLSGKYETI